MKIAEGVKPIILEMKARPDPTHDPGDDARACALQILRLAEPAAKAAQTRALLARLDPVDLLLIEQPLDEEDIIGHGITSVPQDTPTFYASSGPAPRPRPETGPGEWV